jgi:hypothetical protein
LRAALVLCGAAAVQLAGWLIALCGLIFAENDDLLIVYCSGVAVAAFGMLLLAWSIYDLRHVPSTTILTHLLLLIVYGGYALSVGLRLNDDYSTTKYEDGGRSHYANDLSAACATIGGLASLWLAFVGSKQVNFGTLLSVGGFHVLSHALAVMGFLALFLPAMSRSTNVTDPCSMGCGPSGLSLANEVGCRVGTRCIAIDARKGVIPDSRFFSMFRTSVESMKRLGCMERIFEVAVPQEFGHGTMACTGLTHPDAKIFASSAGASRAQQTDWGMELPDFEGSKVVGSKWGAEMGQRAMQGTQEMALKEKADSMANVSVRWYRSSARLWKAKRRLPPRPKRGRPAPSSNE